MNATLDVSNLDFMAAKSQKQLKTFELYALAKRELGKTESHCIIKNELCIVLYQTLWLKEEILFRQTEQEANL